MASSATSNAVALQVGGEAIGRLVERRTADVYSEDLIGSDEPPTA